MASLIEGMFSDSSAIRQKRLADLQEQNAKRKQMSLLNQVAAGRGNLIAEGIAGMFGLKTAAEDKADQIKDMASNLNLETPQGLALFARMLNNQGMTEEAMKVAKLAQELKDKEVAAKRQSELDDLNRRKGEADIQYKKKLTETMKRPSPDWQWKVVGKEFNPTTYQEESVYGWVNPRTQEVKRVGFDPKPPAESGANSGDVKIGTTAKSLQESWGG
jgi:hypothetical protein